jgi:hypothetical protein
MEKTRFGTVMLSKNPACGIVKSSVFSNNKCMDSRRFLNDCDGCTRAPKCKHEPSHMERLRCAVTRLKAVKVEMVAARDEYHKCVLEAHKKEEERGTRCDG